MCVEMFCSLHFARVSRITWSVKYELHLAVKNTNTSSINRRKKQGFRIHRAAYLVENNLTVGRNTLLINLFYTMSQFNPSLAAKTPVQHIALSRSGEPVQQAVSTLVQLRYRSLEKFEI